MIDFYSDIFYTAVVTLATLFTGLVLYYKWSFTYWKRHGLEYLEPSIPFGNCAKLLTAKANFAEQFAEFYHNFKAKNQKHGGVYMFARPFYVLVDPELIKNIMQKDFAHFVNRGFYVNEEVDPLSGHLFNLEGEKWKNLRAKLTATFTSGKMKMMFDTITKCAQELDLLMQETVDKEPLEIKEILTCFTTDVISSCAFGIESNSLKNPNSEFRYYGKRITENTLWETLKELFPFVFPYKLLDMIKYKTTKLDVERFFLDVVKKTVDYREKNNVYRKDFLHLLLQLKNRGKLVDDGVIIKEDDQSKGVTMTINEIAAQVAVFFTAGYETSSSTMTFTLYELAKQQHLQDKVRREIHDVLKKHGDKISYEAIMEMTYMDQVVNETLRKYPPLAFLNRQCTKPYDVPDTNIHLEKGTFVVIPILGLQRDAEFYPDPEKYDPERFNEENKKTRPPYTWLPFGEGPRVCIGLRFGVLQSKIGLTALLRNYRVTLNNKTKQPLVFNKTGFLLAADTGIWLNITKA